MRRFAAILLLPAILLSSCYSQKQGGRDGADGVKSADTNVTFDVPVFNKQYVPSSQRSRSAVDRVAPRLAAELGELGLSYGAPIYIRIFKEERELEIWVKADDRFALFRTYDIAAYSGELGPKLRKGDHQAPEGFYSVTPARMNPNSRFHLSFNLGYPNAYDVAHGRTGSALMVHGSDVSIGCFAMTDEGIEEIYAIAEAALRNGQPLFHVHCFPFRMTESNMKKHSRSEWSTFWKNLKEGYDFFQNSGLPPNVLVRNGEYAFEGQKM